MQNEKVLILLYVKTFKNNSVPIQLLDVPNSLTSFLVSPALIAFNLAHLKMNGSFEAQHGICKDTIGIY